MTNLHSINEEQGLYVLKSGPNAKGAWGYSHMGFDVLERHLANMWAFIRDNASSMVELEDNPHWHGAPKRATAGRYALYEKLCGIAHDISRKYNVRCEFDLSPQLRGLEGHRVEVRDTADAKPRRFIVGKSTGWYPIHLEIAKRTSRGGVGAMPRYADVRDLGRVR